MLQAHFERKTWKGPQWKYAIWIFHKTSNQKPKDWMIYDKTEDFFNHLKRFTRKYTWRKKRFPNNSNLVAFSPQKILFCLIIELESWSFFSFVALDKLRMMKVLLLTWKSGDFVADVANYLPPWTPTRHENINFSSLCEKIKNFFFYI